jgi:hypothetical protein
MELWSSPVFIINEVASVVKGGRIMERYYDSWANPITNVPAEVQAYIDKLNAAEQTEIIDIDSMSYGTPDGNVASETWTVISLYQDSCVTTKHFWYDVTPDGSDFRESDETHVTSTEVLRVAKKLLENKNHDSYWHWLDKVDKAG